MVIRLTFTECEKKWKKKLTNNIAKRKSQHRKKRGTPPNPGKAYRAFHLYQRLRLPLAAVPANQETDDAEHPVNLHGNPHADDAHAHRRREENAEADAKNRHREDRDRHRVLRVARPRSAKSASPAPRPSRPSPARR